MNGTTLRAKPSAHLVHGPRHARGHSLIELMVAVALGLVLVSGLLVLYANSAASAKTNDRTAELQSNGRFAMETLKADLRAAGFKGFAEADPNPPSAPLAPIGNECLEAGAVAASFVPNMRQAIWGSQDSNPFSANCIPNRHYARGDVLVVRKVSATPATNLAANPSRFYLRSNYAASEVFRGAPTTVCPAAQSGYAAPFNTAPCLAGNAGVDLLNFPVEIHVYFIRRYTVSASESPLVPALCRVTLGTDGNMAEEVVASGIEDLRLQYARALSDGSTQYADANGINGTSFASTPTDWDEVHAVRIWLLARSASVEPGYTNTTRYTLGSSTYPRSPAANPGGDGYRRQLFDSVVQLRNHHSHN